MDYTNSNFYFKIQKAVRYARIYGLIRTLIKIRGQYHMKKRYVELPQISNSTSTKKYIGIIGCGNYAFSNIAYYLTKKFGPIIKGCMDVNINASASLFENYNLDYYTKDASDIISDPSISLVFIASNHASHAEYAIECIKAGKHVHIEKPHVVSDDQLRQLCSTMKDNPHVKVFLGFNRPRSPLFCELQEFLKKESGTLMINWFVAGHEIPDNHWYFNQEEGGRILGNLCHWSDLTLHLIGIENAFPCQIIPGSPHDAKSDFVVSIVFADRSCASITFSAKGHTFEGVREVLNVHKGNLLGNITDFGTLSLEICEKKFKKNLLYRNHGHAVNVHNSVTSESGENPIYVHATAKFFLSIKQAVEGGVPVTLSKTTAFGFSE